MKKVLSLLVASIFLQVQTWALSGGPVFVANGNTDLTGVYAGVMVAQSAKGAAPSVNSLTSSIGVFSITVPIAGAATGTTVIFQNNVTYTGTITGAANAGNRSITGIIQATSTSLFTIIPTTTTPGTPQQILPLVPPSTVQQVIPAVAAVTTAAVTSALTAVGTIQAKVSQTRSSTNTGNQGVDGVSRSAVIGGGVNAAGTPVSLGQTGDRLSGTASLDALIQNTAVVGGPTVTNSTKYAISGIRQTNVPAAAVVAP